MAYIDSYQFDLDQEIAAERRAGYCSCPKCGGYPDLDESGRAYTCYFCCDSGVVPQAVMVAWERAERDEREQFRPARLGTFPTQRSDFWEYASDDEIALECRPGNRLFTRLVPSAPAWVKCPELVARTQDDPCWDDIPF